MNKIETPLGCVETIVTRSAAPTGSSMAEGGHMEFRDAIAPGIRELYVAPGDHPVAGWHERVRVCLLGVPKKHDGCDPAKDGRGREFLVYVYTSDPDRQSDNAAVYTNAEHWCGGA
ncbi:MAG TPA: hypothetical protein VGG89_00445 [Candidatus Baltobacteraceae bacterium]